MTNAQGEMPVSERDEAAAVSSIALQIAQTWAQVPPEHLQTALQALEPEFQREHEHRMEILRQAEEGERRRHVQYLCGLGAGFVIAMGMLTGAVVVGINGQPWLAALLTGPSLIALAKLFVIRRADAADTKLITQALRDALNSASPTPIV